MSSIQNVPSIKTLMESERLQVDDLPIEEIDQIVFEWDEWQIVFEDGKIWAELIEGDDDDDIIIIKDEDHSLELPDELLSIGLTPKVFEEFERIVYEETTRSSEA